jgi:glycolate oxidase FAD binding subunit
MIQYKPSEYTFTAWAGTRLEEIEHILNDNGQFLPFDPPLVKHGATLGGTLASGLSGSGRYRFGGLRDFILGVKYMDGNGQLVRAGGKVVKNAAGFDIPKVMVGSLGGFGALLELSFKVFPRPIAYSTVITYYSSLQAALDILITLTVTPLDLFCLDLEPEERDRVKLMVRIGGLPSAFSERIQRLKSILADGEIIEDKQEKELWHAIREFSWLPGNCALVKVPLTPNRVRDMDNFLSERNTKRRYTVGANLTWIGWQGPIEILHQHLMESGLSGLVVIGSPDHPRIGVRIGESFTRRIKHALDPLGRWVDV